LVRYAEFVGDQGVGRCAPDSSSSAISGVAQPDEAAARWTSASAASATVPGSAGSDGVPTIRFSLICQYTVCAPPSRRVCGTVVPLEASTSPGRRKSSLRNVTLPSA
jgi:hypothetical protein